MHLQDCTISVLHTLEWLVIFTSLVVVSGRIRCCHGTPEIYTDYNVGIGTNNPADKLSIYAAPNSLVFGAKDTSRGNHIFQLLADDSAGNGEIRLYQNSGSGTHAKTVRDCIIG